jgi:hypothetical protein
MRTGFLTLVLIAASRAQSSYHVTHTYTLGGDGTWDYVVPNPRAVAFTLPGRIV